MWQCLITGRHTLAFRVIDSTQIDQLFFFIKHRLADNHNLRRDRRKKMFYFLNDFNLTTQGKTQKKNIVLIKIKKEKGS